ncbi:hypothetical protein PAPYR_1720 [Paratrimastix pyriformis]|uniref:BTB domain-containing protein n=1 Tax=Paratrimastix pyriformis TaxID=342808 RepID=A0ABQ8UTG3_9EUKA|nr:hypothetical protein PAPYR_1720 [Paratrimastix pyriformis]
MIRLGTSTDLGFVNSSFTVQAWVKVDNFRTAHEGIRHAILGTTSKDENASLCLGFRSGHPFFDFGENGFMFPGYTLPTGKWAHATFAYDRTRATQAIYINGNRVAQESGHSPLRGNCMLTLGRAAEPEGLDGSLAEVRIWSRTLSPEEIHTRWNECLVGNEPQLVRYFVFARAHPAGWDSVSESSKVCCVVFGSSFLWCDRCNPFISCHAHLGPPVPAAPTPFDTDPVREDFAGRGLTPEPESEGASRVGERLFASRSFADLTLFVGDEHFEAHRAYLWSCNALFRALIPDRCPEPGAVLCMNEIVPPLRPQAFAVALEYLYTHRMGTAINQTTTEPAYSISTSTVSGSWERYAMPLGAVVELLCTAHALLMPELAGALAGELRDRGTRFGLALETLAALPVPEDPDCTGAPARLRAMLQQDFGAWLPLMTPARRSDLVGLLAALQRKCLETVNKEWAAWERLLCQPAEAQARGVTPPLECVLAAYHHIHLPPPPKR